MPIITVVRDRHYNSHLNPLPYTNQCSSESDTLIKTLEGRFHNHVNHITRLFRLWPGTSR